ncbi:hypothetical protein [Bacillus methanolicus]|uniref:Uncharacterized protein n=1 Tax=Bacillus methanolicus (strain MGA3 / ATCC 53907) TaxID=796606 RepID=I3E8R6_BACMM|nr:hypothetical protein [Bacillus methanolicus]AIE60152.1 hypothetical protein BMMGA3_08760 [Bacillus methanolicus MGA3]EIJ82887.1 hypothetical protein MGA3_06665 [Bacillus methanolicus MGA3]
MPKKRPEFMNSPYFVDEPGNWHLKPGAPEAMQQDFDAYMQSLENPYVWGTTNGIKIDYPFMK